MKTLEPVTEQDIETKQRLTERIGKMSHAEDQEIIQKQVRAATPDQLAELARVFDGQR